MWVEGVQCLTSSAALFLRDFGQKLVLSCITDNVERGHNCLGLYTYCYLKRSESKKVSIELRVRLAFGASLPGYTVFLVK